MENIIKQSNTVLTTCNEVAIQLENQSCIPETQIIDISVEHDPGKRTKIVSDTQRQYLIMLGPHQPKLNMYPQQGTHSFNYAWLV